MADLAAYQFNADLAKFAQELELNQKMLVQRVSAELWNSITERNPVKTGRSRSGWAMVIDDVGSFIPPPVVGDTVAPPPQDPDWGLIDGTQAVYIVNHVAYIEALEDGHSQQAPNGMVRLALITAEAKIEAILGQLQ